MFERFTDRARKVMALANQEAQRFNHEYVGTEHILLGLVRVDTGVGACVLKSLGVDLVQLRTKVERRIKSGPDMVTVGKLPQTPRAKKLIGYATSEAHNHKHDCVGTEHLLLGLMHQSDDIAGQILAELGLRLEQLREQVLKVVGPVDPNRPTVHSMDIFEDAVFDPDALDGGIAELFAEAAELSRQQGDMPLAPEHFLVAMLQLSESKPARALAKLGVTREAVVNALREV